MGSPTMLEAQRTCSNCRKIFANQNLVEQSISQDGLNVVQTTDEYSMAIEEGCTICVAVNNLAKFWEGIEDDFTGPFRNPTPGQTLVKNLRSEISEKKRGENIFYEIGNPRVYYLERLHIALGSAENHDHIALLFDVEALDDDPAATWIKTRPLDPAISRPAAFSLAQGWIQTCLTEHTKCSIDPVEAATFTPKRLIKLWGENLVQLESRLHTTQDGEELPYAALSYCWGGPQKVTLSRNTLDSMQSKISLEALPRTLSDAIRVTYELHIPYLWIDAICILQDAEEDKAEQIAVMDKIYHSAQVTICAASAQASNDGFLQQRTFEGDFVPNRNCAVLRYPTPQGSYGDIILREQRLYQSQTEPLYQRAWAFQERLLSPRKLIYGSWQLFWECQNGLKCDRGRVSNIETTTIIPWATVSRNVSRLKQPNRAHLGQLLWITWSQIVSDYSKRSLSVASDKFPALSGIAARCSQLFNQTYVAGLWECNLRDGLKWQVGEPKPYRPSEYRAPTWSWASVFGVIIWPDSIVDPWDNSGISQGTMVLACQATPAHSASPFGRVIDGSLTLQAVAKEIEWNGAEQIPADGLDKDLIPPIDNRIGAALFPDGIIALAKPDVREQALYVVEGCVTSRPQLEEAVEVPFYMGRFQDAENSLTRPILCMVLDKETALMLEHLYDSVYGRVGLLQFKGSADLDTYFEHCNVMTVHVR